jgi:mannose/fructose/N-acetylgalactosamine-specific phosphotransferase system component IIC
VIGGVVIGLIYDNLQLTLTIGVGLGLVWTGVDVYSSWKSPGNYNTISGTSMATPCVAGIAALFWEAFPDAHAAEIWTYLTQNAKRLCLNASDIGAGLVQAPM